MRFVCKLFWSNLLTDFLGSQNDRSDKFLVTATGTGGLAELSEKLDPAKASFAYVRVTYSNDKESQREKFILVTWIGSKCKVMRKAKVSLRIPMQSGNTDCPAVVVTANKLMLS